MKVRMFQKMSLRALLQKLMPQKRSCLDDPAMGLFMLLFGDGTVMLGIGALIAFSLQCAWLSLGTTLLCLGLAVLPTVSVSLVSVSRAPWLRLARKHLVLLLFCGRADFTQSYICICMAILGLMGAMGIYTLYGSSIDEEGYVITRGKPEGV